MRRVERDQDQSQNQKPGWESNPGPGAETETEPGEELLEDSIQKTRQTPWPQHTELACTLCANTFMTL